MSHRSRAANRSESNRAQTQQVGWHATLVLLVLASLLVLPAQQSFGEDTDLLRRNSTNPFLFILLDNSRSMASSIKDEWVHAGADDPRSRLYIAKEVLYEELSSLSDIHYGLATFNQDNVQIVSKHYLYSVSSVSPAVPDGLGDFTTDGLGEYPKVQTTPVESVTTDPDTGEDTTVIDIAGDVLTLGRTFPFSGGVQTTRGGTCAAPLPLSSQREAVNRYPKFGEDGATTVTMWVQGSADNVYRLIWSRPDDATWTLGDDSITVNLNVLEDPPGNSCDASRWGDSSDHTVELTLWREFLWTDDTAGAQYTIQTGSCGAKVGNVDEPEVSGGFWALSPLDVEANTFCAGKPFSGQGWEGNYDTGSPFTTNLAYETTLGSLTSEQTDSYCAGNLSEGDCVNHKYTTQYSSSPDERELDVGDMIPFHWTNTHHDKMLARLNPKHLENGEDFGVATYFTDTAGASGSLEALDSTQRPILAAGISPIGSAALDFRCWATGADGTKCDRSGFTTSYQDGFLSLLATQDPALHACRRPFMIIVTDLYGTCAANSDVADVASMFSETGSERAENGISTWVLNMGTSGCNLTNPGKGETIKVESKSELRSQMRKILGEIEETARAFAAAAVPTVQADIEDKIYFTQFTPLQDQGVWPGEVLAFRKPLPTVITDEGDLVPDRDEKVWDAGLEMMVQSPDPASLTGPYYTRTGLQVGDAADERRVYYMVEPKLWNYFAPVEGSRTSPVDSSLTYLENDLRNDLWQNLLGLSYTPTPLTTEELDDIKANSEQDKALKAAHSVIHNTLIEKVWIEDGVFVRNYILGDIFHSNPQVLSGPSNPFFLADPESFPGYRDFARFHERRRKMLFVGSNDGFMHAFDAGRWEGTYDEGAFNSGTGRELFGYVPREMIPKLKGLNENRDEHQWFVDGTAQLADVLIDVDDDGVKEWRTIVTFGMRRGGESIVALDVTQPDPIQEEKREIGGTEIVIGYLPKTSAIVPDCWDSSNTTDCGPLPFGTPLWEVEDGTDDDGNESIDAGQSWSAPDIGPIRVLVDGQPELRWVAIFGGGLDPAWGSGGGQGNWLYMVDIETGKIIYKRKLGDGSAASPPAAVDTSQNGVLDRVYIGTTDGLLYRVDLSTSPVLFTEDTGTNCTLAAFDDMCITDTDWDPELFFDTVTVYTDPDDGSDVEQRRPFFFRPAVFYVGQLGGFGVALGTGNRDDIWSNGPVGGNRFYVFADELCNNDGKSGDFCLDPLDADTELPLVEGRLTNVTGGDDACTDDVITDVTARTTGERGWFVELGQIPVVVEDQTEEEAADKQKPETIEFDPGDELMVTPPVTISGLTVFSTFVPETRQYITTGNNDDEVSGSSCARRGIGRSYLYFTASGCRLSVTELETLPSDPFLEAAQTQNPSCEEEPDQPHCLSGASADDPCQGTEAVFDELKKKLFPSTCKFSPTFKFNLMTNLSDTGLECIVQIPVCIQQRNWKEF